MTKFAAPVTTGEMTEGPDLVRAEIARRLRTFGFAVDPSRIGLEVEVAPDDWEELSPRVVRWSYTAEVAGSGDARRSESAVLIGRGMMAADENYRARRESSVKPAATVEAFFGEIG